MKIEPLPLFPFLGWNVQGDMGPFTFYTSRRHKLVFYLKAPPQEAPSYLRVMNQNRWAVIAQAWRDLVPAKQQAWLDAARLARLRITGRNLFYYFKCTGDRAAVETVARHAGMNPGDLL